MSFKALAAFCLRLLRPPTSRQVPQRKPQSCSPRAWLITASHCGQILTKISHFEEVTVERFDTQHFTMEQQIQLTGNSVSSLKGIRFGQHGLAYVIPSTTQSQTSQIFLIRGPFVLPAEGVANAVPTLGSTQSILAAGRGNVYLSVRGTGFLPGAVVLWMDPREQPPSSITLTCRWRSRLPIFQARKPLL